MATTSVYQEKVNKLLQEKSTLFSIGLFTLFFIVTGILIATNQERISVAEIDRQNREEFLKQQEQTSGAVTYTVEEGEGLWQIAEKTTGNGENWTKIAMANNITNPDTIEAGQTLKIPDVTATAAPSAAPTAAVPTQAAPQEQPQGQIDGGMTTKANPGIKEYTLLEGEGLWQAAEKVYGDGNMWTVIAEANNLMATPDAVSPGMKLKIPSN